MGSEAPVPDIDSADFGGVIALDGPSGTGKSTVARSLATRLGVGYLDTGAMYRAATLAVLNADVDLANAAAIAAVVAQHRIEVGTDPAAAFTTLDGVNVDSAIRSSATTAAVSAVSAVAAVRTQLVRQQRDLITRGPIVAEGRDVGSVVWPEAELKIYLTASEETRARRRADELKADLAEVSAALRRRDDYDSSRAVSPLTRPDGATEIDTSDLTVNQVVELLVQLALQPVSAGDRG